jgi:tetratricopeptide (TPR) repeat protein
MLHDAVVAVDDGVYQQAIPLLEKVTASEPEIPIAQLHLGVAWARQRQYARAVAPLRRAVALSPTTCGRTTSWASRCMRPAISTRRPDTSPSSRRECPDGPTRATRSGRCTRASIGHLTPVAELRAALDLEPRHFRANLLLGRLLTLRGDAALAVPYLRTAVDAQPDSSEAKQFLADALKNRK